MSADLHIHAMGKLNADDLECFFSGNIDSKYFAIGDPACRIAPDCLHWRRVEESENTWIGEVSWLKASLLGDMSYVPEPVEAVNGLIGEDLPVLDEELKHKILQAVATPNERAGYYRTAACQEVAGWLDGHMGEKLFTVSW